MAKVLAAAPLPARVATRVAILDGGSFVLPYDAGLIRMLAGHGVAVDFYASRTGYNGELLDALAQTAGVRLHLADVSGSVAPRGRGALAYLALLLRLAARSRRCDTINLQFSAAWPVELPFLIGWRRRLVYTVHNPVPHGHTGLRHRPTGWIARLARELVFVSEFSRDDFLRRYGRARFGAKSRVVPHGLLPTTAAGGAPVAYGSTGAAPGVAAPGMPEPTLQMQVTAGPVLPGRSEAPGVSEASGATEAPVASVAFGAAAVSTTPVGPAVPNTPNPPTALVFWGNVQPYKGVELFAALARSDDIRRRGLRLEVHGAWPSRSMAPLRRELLDLGVMVRDRFLGAAELPALMARDDALFLLPYREASQSGALYTLLHAGRRFACSDVGDLGAFMRRFGLADLLLEHRDVASVLACLDRLQAAPDRLNRAYAMAQRQSDWGVIWPAAAAVYRAPLATHRDATIAPRRP